MNISPHPLRQHKWPLETQEGEDIYHNWGAVIKWWICQGFSRFGHHAGVTHSYKQTQNTVFDFSLSYTFKQKHSLWSIFANSSGVLKSGAFLMSSTLPLSCPFAACAGIWSSSFVVTSVPLQPSGYDRLQCLRESWVGNFSSSKCWRNISLKSQGCGRKLVEGKPTSPILRSPYHPRLSFSTLREAGVLPIGPGARCQ